MSFPSILITGGTGSLGRALAFRLDSPRICIFSRDEFKQAEMKKVLPGNTLRWFIGDVRDFQRLKRAFQGVEIVIHAAALKRVETGVNDASELVKTNVQGTLNVIEAAHESGVKKVLCISTDKACSPVSAYGASKLLMEKVTIAANNAYGPKFSVIRLGNFAGSRGSVIDNWRRGGREISNPDCTRFWITEKTACQEVEKALTEMKGGEIFQPKMQAFRLGDLAKAMKLEVLTQTGLGPEERMHEYMGSLSSEYAEWMTVEELCSELESLRAWT
jgi:UDP-N-acetylglucosamine 4,6-dehydratase